MPDINILLVPGSLREASSSRATARALAHRLGDHATFTTADIGKLPHYNADVTGNTGVAEFLGLVQAADGIIFVTPEYNYSVPGVLKNAIDWASRPAYASVFRDKPCCVVSVSGGALGGVRAQAHLKYILNGMLARVHSCKEIVIPHANAKVSDGMLNDEDVLAFAETEIRPFLDSLG
ncbi:NADPH-dependent FMN reductase [Roseibium sp. Sym1]|uniref:NADPH-dependent FMN reductase n=1 Tax=Roseibium sp. Sym1 TaxID=3016006 RepID=UPI0022B35097|nr:NAD(P)H-dependent oxidoreductase [Roseibium sp. Sym1]